jgi:hypothetical protein
VVEGLSSIRRRRAECHEAADHDRRVDTQCRSDPHDVVKRDVPLPTLNLPDVGPMQFTEVGKRRLAELEVIAAQTDASPELLRDRREGRFSCGPRHGPTPSIP